VLEVSKDTWVALLLYLKMLKELLSPSINSCPCNLDKIIGVNLVDLVII